jgi:leucine dehydrogenase
VEHLVKDGAKVWINDINSDNLSAVTQKVSGVTVADAETMFDLDMDIYAPCALGASVNSASLEKLKCAIIAGAANNQLADEDVHGKMCSEKGILYAPDFLINAGGLINVSIELEGYNRERAYAKTEHIFEASRNVFSIAKQENIPTIVAAKRLAEQRIDSVGRIRLSF